MPSPPPLLTEDQRLEALYAYEVLDSGTEQTTDDLACLASHIAGTAVAYVSLIDADRQWFKARVGLDATELPRDLALCAWTVLGDKPMIVPDATLDSRFAENPLVTGEYHLRFYAGFPLVTPEGHAIGTLCVADNVAGDLTDAQREDLERLARTLMQHLESRRTANHLAEALRDVRALSEMIPFCAHCHRVREDDIYQRSLERWLHEHAGTTLSHGICPDCLVEHFPEVSDDGRQA